MLLRFRARNVLSFRDEFELSLLSPQKPDSLGHPVPLALAVVYGANASGKSNLLDALRWMHRVVTGSVSAWADEPGVPDRPYFALDDHSCSETSMCEIDIILDNVRYLYGFELSDERVVSEWLHAYPKSRRQVWFERTMDDYSFPSDRLSGVKPLVQVTRRNSLFLSTAAQFNHPRLMPIRRWFGSNIALVHQQAEQEQFSTYELAETIAKRDLKEQVEELLRCADLGISRIEFTAPETGRRSLRLLHYGDRGQEVPVELEQESTGTLSWLAFVPVLLNILENGRTAFIDELDSSLHPKLVAEVLRLFKNPQANRHGAQLICTAHDASLIGSAHVERPLEREEVWIVEKRRHGNSEVYPVTDMGVRREENLERALLRGRLGGVPDIATNALADEIISLSRAA